MYQICMNSDLKRQPLIKSQRPGGRKEGNPDFIRQLKNIVFTHKNQPLKQHKL